MKTPEHVYFPSCARCRDEAGKDRAGVIDTSLCNWHTNDLVLTLRTENERLRSGVRSYYNALLNYGRHWPDCATPKSGDRCDCGLSGWLTEKALERAALAAPPEGGNE